MWLNLVANTFFLVGASCVILRDPRIRPCDDYDLFDPIRRIITEPLRLTTDADYEHLAQKAVHQLNARSNGMFKSMLVRLKSYKTTRNGRILLTVQQMESRCRNDGKMELSLAKCPLNERGLVQECNLTVNVPTTSNQKVLLDKFSCRRIPLEQVLDVGAVAEISSGLSESSIVRNAPVAGYQAPSMDNFRCFMLRYSKNYGNNEAQVMRFKQFQDNMKLAYLLQATEQGSGVYGPSIFSDLTPAEFRRYSTGLKPNLAGQILKRAVIPRMDNALLPLEFDWRNKSAVTPVKDQGQCGSCWAFSTTGNVEGQWAIKKGKLVLLSEQELVDCDKLDEGCGGGLPSNAYKEIIRLGGLETESDYPYDGKNDKCSFKKQEVVQVMEKHRVYVNDSVSISTNETEMAKWLVQNGPISIGINANAMMLYMGGVSHPWKIVCSPKNLDHGVLIVGYGVDAKKQPYWTVKNSWGPHWGVKGYYLVYRGDGTCGLNMMCTSAVIA